MGTTLITILPGLLTGIAACIPLCIQLVKAIKSLVKEKRWSKLMQAVVNLMATAEVKLSDGADRKVWVLAMAKSFADDLGCEYDEVVIGDMIDSIAAMAKIVNVDRHQEVEA